MVRRNALILAAIAAVAVVTGILHFANVEPVVVFVVAAAALGGLAWAISIATESVGERFGPAVTGALQSTLGNLPELFIVLFALSAGELVVARTAILGSLFANGLLVQILVAIKVIGFDVRDDADRRMQVVKAAIVLTCLDNKRPPASRPARPAQLRYRPANDERRISIA